MPVTPAILPMLCIGGSVLHRASESPGLNRVAEFHLLQVLGHLALRGELSPSLRCGRDPSVLLEMDA